MSLLDLYESAPGSSYVGNVRDTVATVADGDQGVNFFDQNTEYQDNFRERASNNKVVTQSTGDDDTNGHFTDKALLFYANHYNALNANDKLIHLYYQRQPDSWYSRVFDGAKGITQTYQLG